MNILYFILTIIIVVVALGIGCLILKFIGVHYSNKRVNDLNYDGEEITPYNELDDVNNDDDDDDLTYKLM